MNDGFGFTTKVIKKKPFTDVTYRPRSTGITAIVLTGHGGPQSTRDYTCRERRTNVAQVSTLVYDVRKLISVPSV